MWKREILEVCIFVLLMLIYPTGHYIWFPIAIKYGLGYSMYPTITPHSTLVLVATYITGFRVGDIVGYINEDGKLVIHRIGALLPDNKVVIVRDCDGAVDRVLSKNEIKYKLVALAPPVLSPIILGVPFLYTTIAPFRFSRIFIRKLEISRGRRR